MFYVRSPVEGSQEAINEAMSVLWQVRDRSIPLVIHTSHIEIKKLSSFCFFHKISLNQPLGKNSVWLGRI